MPSLKEQMKDLHQYHKSKDEDLCSTCIYDEEAEYYNYCDKLNTTLCKLCKRFYCENYVPKP